MRYTAVLITSGCLIAAIQLTAAEGREFAPSKIDLVAQGLYRKIGELEKKHRNIPGATLAETIAAAVFTNYMEGSPEAEKARAEIQAKNEDQRKTKAALVLEMNLLLSRLQVYRETGKLPDMAPNARELQAYIEHPWDAKPGGSDGLEQELPKLIQQLERFHADPPRTYVSRPVPAHKAARESLVEAPAMIRLRRSDLSPTKIKHIAPMAKPKADPVEELITSLAGPDPRSRALAADSLGNLGISASAAVPALRKALSDNDPRVRASAALALGSVALSSTEVIDDLKRALLDANEDVRFSSQVALGRLSTAR